MASPKKAKRAAQPHLPHPPNDISNSPDSSLDDENRRELLWETREETLLLSVQQKCEHAATKHERSGYRKKRLYALFGIPSTILPLITATLTQMGEDTFVSTILMMVCGILTGVNTFFNFGRQRQCQFEFAGKYQELAMEIGVELCKPKKNRLACDVFLDRITNKFNNLNNTAPT